jgi:Outer membrane protein beta-barrel domain
MRGAHVRRFVLIASALAGIATAQADELDYTYVEAGFGRVEIDNVDTGDGLFLGGSLGFGTNWLAFGEYSTSSFDVGGTNVDFNQIVLGLGGHFPIADSVDFVGKVGYVDASADVGTPFGTVSVDDNGYLLSGGVRALVAQSFELAASVDYVDYGDSDDTGINLWGLYRFNELFSLGARAGFADNTDEYGVFGRLTF